MTDFFVCLAQYSEDEQKIRARTFVKENARQADIRRVEFAGCSFSGCQLGGADFTGASFQNTTFTACDFSNACLRNAYFDNCRFSDCRLIGADFSQSLLQKTAFCACPLRSACFDMADLRFVSAEDCDFSEASIRECKLKNVRQENCIFIRNNFFKTALKGIDFSTGVFSAPTVSMPPEELRGIRISAMQAADLIQLFGIEVI